NGYGHLRHDLAHVLRVETTSIDANLAKRIKHLNRNFESVGKEVHETRQFRASARNQNRLHRGIAVFGGGSIEVHGLLNFEGENVRHRVEDRTNFALLGPFRQGHSALNALGLIESQTQFLLQQRSVLVAAKGSVAREY